MISTGRFAPSPTGPLHFGSLIAATASYLAARSKQGRWLLRIEDLDQPRVQNGASEHIISTLIAFGFEWDDVILYQSQRQIAYQTALKKLSHLTYPCYCSRKQLAQQAKQGAYGYIYPNTCRHLSVPTQSAAALRIITPEQFVGFQDQIVGDYRQQLASEIGDFVLKRADGMFTYQFAVVVDDAFQAVTEIVRGADLLDNTPRQLYLQRLLGYSAPSYAHLPLVLHANGQKLSKQTLAPALDTHNTIALLVAALQFLGQSCPPAAEFTHIQQVWDWAIRHWDIQQVPKLNRALP